MGKKEYKLFMIFKKPFNIFKHTKNYKNITSVRDVKTKRAFTMIELIIILLISAMLIGIVYPNLKDTYKNIKVEQMKSDIQSVNNAVNWYIKENQKIPIKEKVDINSIEYGFDFKEFMLNETNDNLTELYSIDYEKLKPYITKTKNVKEDFYYTTISNQVVYPKGKINSNNQLIYNDYKNIEYIPEEEPNKPIVEPEPTPPNMRRLYAGWYSSLLLKRDGTVWETGILGNRYFKQVESLSNIDSIFTQYYKNFALSENGEVYVWGDLGGDKFTIVPKKLQGLPKITTMETRFGKSFLLGDDGTVWECINSSVKKVQGLENIVDISVEKYFALALNDKGEVYSWGYNEYGQLGLGHNKPVDIPTKIVGLQNVKEIFTGYDNSYFIMNNGTIYACGRNDYGQLGLGFISSGTDPNTYIPKEIPYLRDIATMEVPDSLTLSARIYAIDKYGNVYGWGDNKYAGYRVLGIKEEIDKISTPTKIPNLSNIMKISCMEEQNFAISNDGDLYVWGVDYGNGFLGLGENIKNISTPQKNPHVSNVSNIETGAQHVVLTTNANEVYTWGYNLNGQLGTNDNYNRNVPTKLEPFR